MTNVERDIQRLREYQAELGTALETLAQATAEVEELRTITRALEARVRRQGGDPGPTPEQTAQGARGSDDELATLAAQERPGAPKRSLTGAIRDIMADGQKRNVDDVVDALALLGMAPEGRSERQTMVNRLYDLKEQGFLKRLGRGVYQLATAVQAEPSLPVSEGNGRMVPDPEEDQSATPGATS